MKPSLLIPLIYLCMMFASPAHAGWFSDLVGGSDAMRVDMRMAFVNGVEYKSHGYCERPVALDQNCVLTFVMPPDNIVPRSTKTQGADPTKMVFVLARAKKDAKLPEDTLAAVFIAQEYGNDQYALHTNVVKSNDQAMAKGEAELALLYNSATAGGITGLRPNRMKLGTVTFKTSPDDR